LNERYSDILEGSKVKTKIIRYGPLIISEYDAFDDFSCR